MKNTNQTILRHFSVVLLFICNILLSQVSFAQSSAQEECVSEFSHSTLGLASAKSAADIEKTQVRTYSTNDPSITHGYAAEDANATSDRLSGKKVVQTGPSNGSDNPDRISGGVEIQTKYCKTASATVNTSFNKHTGMYRYPGQQLEVPKDQYEEAVKLFEQKIREGKVKGITDPADARKIIRKGKYTYKQTVEIVKPGTYESIKFDIKTGIVSSSIAAGITFAIVFEQSLSKGYSADEALKIASKESGFALGTTLTAHVVTKQMLRSDKFRFLKEAIDNVGSKAIDYLSKTEFGEKVVTKLVGSSTSKELVGTAARRIGSQLFSSTIITSTSVLLICAVPDIWDASTGKKTWKQTATNIGKDALELAGGLAGATVGATIGTFVAPGVGTSAGAIIGGVVGGIATTLLVDGTDD